VVEAVTEPAPAKINAFLRVLGRRDDGYHEIETLVLPVTLADGVQVSPAEGIQLTVAGDRASEVPAGEDNLVLRATHALRDRLAEKRGAHVLLSKRIPVGAGLGGGSADAAATLRALDSLWGSDLGLEELMDVAAEVGSDVPALLHKGPVIARGRGERVKPTSLPKTWWVLATQRFGVSSEAAYSLWDEGGITGPDARDLLDALARGDLERAARLLSNDLEPVVKERHPEVAEARRALLDAGAVGTIMSGSGPTVAGLTRNAAHAEELVSSVGGIAVATMGDAPPAR
jgi:4-diphosphocytidyl-2-C-methyl-D-erythritol kinase